METLQHYPTTPGFTVAPPANDDCARVPVMRPQPGYRRLALRSDQSRRNLAAVVLAAAFCFHWFVVRDATPGERDAVRAELQSRGDPASLARFDAALRTEPSPSLLSLHLLSRASRN